MRKRWVNVVIAWYILLFSHLNHLVAGKNQLTVNFDNLAQRNDGFKIILIVTDRQIAQ